ncbi:transcriptional regulator, TetR family [Kaistia soli DSM 19436]|uniref:Transcriptional regulator, TetR family n=1 Tax=Kaistia soli DSM 19436 TaxID=1122133 RepID=A0A1M4XU43_9HYPH|nr:CerR family C-terminal domain-containing protein [Kaistia soli]SHE96965.1 transcriptional regulator, TetR family [Kaistia soli DSM 19436]
MTDSGMPEAAASERSRHYQRARQDRGAETRQRLIAAALDIFGRQGFEAASTREIARSAGANLAAIVYHFGSKEGLHLAVAEHVTGEIGRRIGVTIGDALHALSQGNPDKIMARRLLQQITEAHLEAMLSTRDAENWARFVVREQMEPSPVLDVIVGFMAPVHAVLRRLVGILTDSDPDSDETGLRVFTLIGQMQIFRVAQPLVLRIMGRDEIGPADRHSIMRVINANIDRIVGVTAEAAKS